MRTNPIASGINNASFSFTSKKDIKIIPSSKPSDLEKGVIRNLGINPSDTVIKKFANTETYVRINDDLRNKDVYLMPSSGQDVNEGIMEINLKADAAKRSGAKKVVAVLPNFPYARQERRSEAGEPVSARVVIDTMIASGVDEFITTDLHSSAIEGFAPSNHSFYHLSSLPLAIDYLNDKNLNDPVVVSPDEGGAKRAKKLADALGVKQATIQKTRIAHNSARALGLFGDVSGKDCIIYDDMIDTAGTISEASRLLKEKGANDIYILATHGLFNGNAYQKLENAPVKEVIVTNSVPLKPNAPVKIKQIDSSAQISGAILDISA